MTVRQMIADLSKFDMDAQVVMPSRDGSGVYVPIEAIENNYHVERDGTLWFPEGDFDPHTGKMHVFNQRAKPPMGSTKAVVLWEKTLIQRGATPTRTAGPRPVQRVATATAPVRRPLQVRFPRLRLPRVKGHVMFRFVLAACLVYIAWPHKALILSNTLFALVAGFVLAFVLFAPVKGR